MFVIFSDTLPEGPEVTLEAMLEARDRRAGRQRLMREAYGCALVSFTLNIAGPVKTFPLARQTFEEGKLQISRQITRSHWTVAQEETTDQFTGYEALWAVYAAPLDLKLSMASIEEWHPLGRLFDIDVIDPDGAGVNRGQAGFPERACLVCGKPGAGCARDRSHPLEEILKCSVSIMGDYFREVLAGRISHCAIRALLHEACITPKPGLVDRANSGAHTDMNLFTFIDSGSALGGYFHDVALIGMAYPRAPAEEVLPRLRYRGLLAEDTMLSATGGVNTHKGLIFSIGILCAALGQAYGEGQTASVRMPSAPENDSILEHDSILEQASTLEQAPKDSLSLDLDGLLARAGRLATPILGDLNSAMNNTGVLHSGAEQNNAEQSGEIEQSGGGRSNAVTRGMAQYAKYGVTGVRGEAAAGFPSVRCWGLPVLEARLSAGDSLNDAGVAALLSLMAHVTDTNILSRSDMQTLEDMQTGLTAYLKDSALPAEELIALANELDERLIASNLSPGGCADLLAITLALYYMEQDGLFGQND